MFFCFVFSMFCVARIFIVLSVLDSLHSATVVLETGNLCAGDHGLHYSGVTELQDEEQSLFPLCCFASRC